MTSRQELRPILNKVDLLRIIADKMGITPEEVLRRLLTQGSIEFEAELQTEGTTVWKGEAR